MNRDIVFYSHAKNTSLGSIGTKLLKVHIDGVIQKAVKSFFVGLRFNVDTTILKSLLIDICKLHDLGKYSVFFQDYLLKRGKIDTELRQHCRFGAYVIYQKYKEQDSTLALFAYFIVISHHSNLIDLKEYGKKEGLKADEYQQQFVSQKKSVFEYLEIIKSEISVNQLSEFLSVPEFKECRNEMRSLRNERANIQNYFLINYVFSLLIESDKLDASDTPLFQREIIAVDSVDRRLQNSTNELRNYVRKIIIGKLERPDILVHKIFTLTAPTGVGKTLAALDFVLKLRDKIYKTEGYLPQIIYSLPFINIIEQALDEYQNTMPGVEILAHYQYSDIFEHVKSENEEFNEADYNRRLMQLDTWQSDIVITSFVQFFHTLIGNRNKILKKFNHLAGAIVILDEVQTLSLEKIPLIGASLYYLSKFLGTRIVIMTATRPLVFELAFREIISEPSNINCLDEIDQAFFKDGKLSYLELLDNNKNIYESYRRTVIIPKLDRVLVNEQDFIISKFGVHWLITESCIIVVNKVSRSIALFESVKNYISENGYENPVYYLSTNIIPYHRFEIIKRIKEDLKAKRCPVLISTQVVEAGVDLNFDMGFRDIAPVDSIIQVAGRINREANPVRPEREHLPLYIVDFGDCKTIYGIITYNQSKKAMLGKSEIKESNYLDLVNDYFSEISGKASFDYSRNIFNSMKMLQYDGNEHAVSEFKIIEEQQNVCSVFIELDEAGTAAKEAFLKIICISNKEEANLKRREFDTKYKKTFDQRIITIPFYFVNKILPIHPLVENILLVDHNMVDTKYDIETGFKRQKENETHSMFF